MGREGEGKGGGFSLALNQSESLSERSSQIQTTMRFVVIWCALIGNYQMPIRTGSGPKLFIRITVRPFNYHTVPADFFHRKQQN